MRKKTGDTIEHFQLPAIDGNMFDTHALAGKPVLLSFFRFAACPLCNLRVNELVKKHPQLPEDFTIIAVFDSPLDNLQRYANRHQAPFPILADEGNYWHKRYGVEQSVTGVLLGMLLRLPQAIYGVIVKGYIPLHLKGDLTTMPADFLIDRDGIIQHAFYARDEGAHMPFNDVLAFANTQQEK